MEELEEMTDCVKSSIGNRCITQRPLIYCVKSLSNTFSCQNQIVCTQIIYTVNTQQSSLFSKYFFNDMSQFQIRVDSMLLAMPSWVEYERGSMWVEYQIRNSKSQPPFACPDLQRVQVLFLDFSAV